MKRVVHASFYGEDEQQTVAQDCVESYMNFTLLAD